MDQKYCRKCAENVLVLGQVDYSKPSKRVTWEKNPNSFVPEMAVVWHYPSIHEHDLCYYHSKFSEKGRRIENGIPSFYMRESRPRKQMSNPIVTKKGRS